MLPKSIRVIKLSQMLWIAGIDSLPYRNPILYGMIDESSIGDYRLSTSSKLRDENVVPSVGLVFKKLQCASPATRSSDFSIM